jgi:hypothetical protein
MHDYCDRGITMSTWQVESTQTSNSAHHIPSLDLITSCIANVSFQLSVMMLQLAWLK